MPFSKYFFPSGNSNISLQRLIQQEPMLNAYAPVCIAPITREPSFTPLLSSFGTKIKHTVGAP